MIAVAKKMARLPFSRFLRGVVGNRNLGDGYQVAFLQRCCAGKPALLRLFDHMHYGSHSTNLLPA